MNEGLQVFSVLALIALGIKLLSLLKFLTSPGRDINAFVTQLGAFAIGVGLAFVAGEAAGFEQVEVNGVLFGKLGGADLVLVGLALGASMSVTYDFVLKRGTNPEPPLLGDSTADR